VIEPGLRSLLACLHACVRACVLVCLRACVRACVLACLRSCVLACALTCLCACMLPHGRAAFKSLVAMWTEKVNKQSATCAGSTRILFLHRTSKARLCSRCHCHLCLYSCMASKCKMLAHYFICLAPPGQ
jgi:hypothetical protein